MATIHFSCPHCSHSMQVPATIEGKRGKCPACGETAIITQSAPVSPSDPLSVPGAPQPPEINPGDRGQGSAIHPGPSAGTRTRRSSDSSPKQLFSKVMGGLKPETSPLPVGNPRYPNLTKYLAILEILIKILFYIGLIAIILLVAWMMLLGLWLMLTNPFGYDEEFQTTEWNSVTQKMEDVTETYHIDSTFLPGLGLFIGSPIGGLLYCLLLLWGRLVALAGVEIVRVFMDVESNTRKQET